MSANVKLFFDFRARECELVNENRSSSQSSTVESSPAVIVENSSPAMMLDSSPLNLSFGESGSLFSMVWVGFCCRTICFTVLRSPEESTEKTAEFNVDVGGGGSGE
uniref:Uncharacterized protein n=1 Tax=Nicotiana tabacum TaxID=4097 RepID=A0A1S3X138_TOBAC|nr:PREDICTED: uncharacterized protein LOC107760130 [Nicotiana tabacum]